MHPAGNFTTIVLTRGCTGTCAASWALGEWWEGQNSCRNVGDIVGLFLMENGHIKRPTLHLSTENQVPAPLISILSVTIVAPLEIIFKGVVLLRIGWSKEASSEKEPARGDICTHQARARQGQAQKPGWAQSCVATATSWFAFYSQSRSPLWTNAYLTSAPNPGDRADLVSSGPKKILRGGCFPRGIGWGAFPGAGDCAEINQVKWWYMRIGMNKPRGIPFVTYCTC